LPTFTLAGGGLHHQNSSLEVSLCIGQPLSGAEAAAISRIQLGVFSSITPEGEGP
jgi:hypothetical protein